jgi:AcrR family transcriptional regulator
MVSFFEHLNRNGREKSAGHQLPGEAAIDRRALRTRTALHEALIRLIVERGYDEITVGDITEAADVGRSTFYAHFTDKDDLLRSGTGRLRAVLFQEHQNAVAGENRFDRRTLGFSRFMTEHLKEEHQLYRALMRGRAGPIILDKIRQYLCEIVRSELATGATGNAGDMSSREIAVQFLVGAYMSVLTWWLDRGAKEPVEEIDRAFRDLALGGIGTMLEGRAERQP